MSSELAVALPWLRMLQVTRGAIAAETAAALPSDLKSLPKMKAQTETLNFETGTPNDILFRNSYICNILLDGIGYWQLQ